MPSRFASTYQQVVKNMDDLLKYGDVIQEIEKYIEILGDLTEDFPFESLLELALIVKQLQEQMDHLLQITDPSNPGDNGDIIITDDGIKVIGIHINTSNSNENTPPNGYKQGITYEIKNTEVIGLKGQQGVTKDYCLVMTAVQDSRIEGVEETIEGFTAFQLAYGTDGLILYKRDATSDMSSWGQWVSLSGGSGGEATKQFIQTENNQQPEEGVQVTGDYWMETLS